MDFTLECMTVKMNRKWIKFPLRVLHTLMGTAGTPYGYCTPSRVLQVCLMGTVHPHGYCIYFVQGEDDKMTKCRRLTVSILSLLSESFAGSKLISFSKYVIISLHQICTKPFHGIFLQIRRGFFMIFIFFLL